MGCIDHRALHLAVYFSFRFQTGPGGDFASLVSKIGPPTKPVSAGTRMVDVSNPGFGAAPVPGVTLGVEGALRTFNMPDTPWPAGAQIAYEASLRAALAPPAAGDPIVSPPVYGRTQSGASLPATDAQPPVWLGELNLDPRNRVAAAAADRSCNPTPTPWLGLPGSNSGEIRKANQLLRQAQLAREVSGSISRRHLQTIAGDGVLSDRSPALFMRKSTSLYPARLRPSLRTSTKAAFRMRRYRRACDDWRGRIAARTPTRRLRSTANR